MIAVKDMKMPKSCWDCPILCKEDGQCEISGKYIYGNDIPVDCPLVKIITCKDCNYYRSNLVEGITCYWCNKDNCVTNEDFYCANAESEEVNDRY